MERLIPLPVVVPLLAAAAVAALNPVLRRMRRTLDGITIAACASVAVILGVLAAGTAHGDAVYWFAGIRPAHQVAIGIDFVASPLAAGLACLAAVLVTAAMVFSSRYFEHVTPYFRTLMLASLAGLAGFCLAGDIFDLFVWFELLSVSAYALTAYRPDERGPLQGALTFAITNSVGAYLTLSGIAVVYGRTGALNMAQIGRDLASRRPDGLVVVAFVLIITGLLVKAAVVPFHFWLADAIAVAPTPAGLMFAGVLIELGLYGVARVYWSMFGAALGHRSTVTATFLTLGLLTAVAGALFCLHERHVKRLLAFAAISHAGLFMAGFALLTPLGLAGVALYVVEHALLMAVLFFGAGTIVYRLGSADESALHGRGRGLRATGALLTIAALGLAGLPPFATFLARSWIGDSAASAGLGWVTIVMMSCSAVAAGSVLRFAGGTCYGLGDPPGKGAQTNARLNAPLPEESGETDRARQRTPSSMIVPGAVLVLAALAPAFVPHLGAAVQAAAIRLQDQAAYAGTVLSGGHVAHPAVSGRLPAGVTAGGIIAGAGTAAGGVVIAFLALYWRRLPLLRRASLPGAGLARAAARIQSGVVNDYVTWMVLGIACIGGALAAAIR